MLTITVSHNADGARRYFKDGLSKEGNYYLDQHIKAFWAGRTSKMLGIEDKQVTEESFTRLVNRVHPEIEGEKVGVRYSKGARAGVDLTFSAPKCVSLLYSLTKNPEVLEIHRRSYRAAMLEVEEMMHTQCNSKYARGFTKTSNIVYAAFDHFLSRPTEEKIGETTRQIASPNLHSHCYIPNVTWNEKEGRYQALEIYTVHKNSDFIKTSYHNALALELEAAGFQTERDGNFIKLSGVDRDLIERFSGRSLEINRIAGEKGLSAGEKGELGKLTRKSKSKMSLTDQQLYEYWLKKVSKSELANLKTLKGKQFDRYDPINVRQAVDRALENAFERNSVENEKKVIAYATKLGYSHLTIDQVKQELQSRENILKSERDTIEYIATREMVQEEDRMIELATSGKSKFPALNKDYKPKLDFLNVQQRKAIKDILSSYDQTMILRGAPGVGKTSLLSEVRQGVNSAGKSLIAIAPSSQASQVLTEKGFESDTIAGLLSNPGLQEKLQNNVLLIDEAGMVGVKNMSELLALSNQYRCRTILSGDTKQNQPPAQYGDALQILEKRSGLQVSSVNKIMRQRNNPAYQSSVQDIYKGDVFKGVQKLEKQGALIEIPDHEDRIKKLAKDYVETISRKQSALIVTPTHREGDLINQAVREEMKNKKRLHGPERSFDVLKDSSLTEAEKKDLLSYRKGQIIRFTKNQKGGYKAGSHHEVVEITKDQKVKVRELKTGRVSYLPHQSPEYYNVNEKRSVSLKMGDQIRLTNNARSLEGTKMANGTSYGVKGFNKRGIELSNGKTIPHDLFHFRYAYAETSYSSQGKDAHTVILSLSTLSDGGINEKSFMVGVSRGTKEVRIYTSDKAFLKQSITRAADRISAKEVAQDHHQRALQRQQRTYQRNLEQKMKSHEKLQGRKKATTRSFSQDRSRG